MKNKGNHGKEKVKTFFCLNNYLCKFVPLNNISLIWGHTHTKDYSLYLKFIFSYCPVFHLATLPCVSLFGYLMLNSILLPQNLPFPKLQVCVPKFLSNILHICLLKLNISKREVFISTSPLSY